MLSSIAAFFTSQTGIITGLGALIIAYILKRIDNKWVYKPLYGVCYAAGVVCTAGLSKFRWTKPFWNKTIEPFVVDLLDNVFSAIKNGLFDGLHSDNPEE